MSQIAIITDSTALLPAEWVQEHDVLVLPLLVIFGERVYKEGIDLTAEDFYPKLQAERILPTTSQASIGEMVNAFEQALQNHDQIIGIFISSGLSGTVSTARAAAMQVGGDITIIDSLITSYPMELMVREAVRIRDAGGSKEEIVQRVEELVRTTKALFIVDSLEYLQRSGRLSKAAALVGSLLQVKPILYVTPDGKLDVLEKVRTKKRAIERVFELVKQSIAGTGAIQFGVVHSANLPDAEDWVARLKEEFPGCEIGMDELGPVIGAHVGPGLVAVFYYPEQAQVKQ